MLYALLKRGLIYTSYQIKAGKILLARGEMFDIDELKEGHFFDEKKEYRLIRRESRNDLLKLLFTEAEEQEMDRDLLMEEKVLVKSEYIDFAAGVSGSLRIINRYAYSEDDTLVLRNYRIAV